MNSKITKNIIRRTSPWFTVFLVICILSSTRSGAQEYQDFLLKKVGNLYILNVGADSHIKNYQIYNLFFEEVKRIPLLGIRVKTLRRYFGAVQVTQLFSDYCVVRIVARYMEEEPKGTRIVLVKRELPEELLQRAYAVSGLELPKELQEKIDRTPTGETITKDIDIRLKEASYRPFEFGINYFHDFDQIAIPVSNDLEARLENFIYKGVPDFASDFSSNGGVSFSSGKMLSPRFFIQGRLSYITQKSELKTSEDPNAPIDKGLVSIKNWDFKINSKVLDWSLSLQFSQFQKALSYLTGETRGRPFAPRFGVGLNYATVKIEMDEKAIISRYIGDEERVLSEKFDMGGYWGMHAIAAIDYYIQAGRVYCEFNYQRWFSDKFKSDIPIRFGASIFF